MNVIGLDGKEYDLSFKRYRYNSRRTKNKSGLHLTAREILSRLIPYETVYEEVSLPGSRTRANGILYADFFAPNLELIIEVHGQQHYEYSARFHKTKADFRKSQLRDKKKRQWCELNGIGLIELSYNEVDKWEHLILEWL